MKKLNAYLPFWFLLILPPLVILTGIINLVMSVVGLIVGAVILKLKDPFSNYYKDVWKIFLLSCLGSGIMALGYAIPEIFAKNEFMLNNLVTPLEYNPYTNIFSFIYMVLLLIIVSFVLYTLNKKLIIKNYASEDKIKLASILITLFIIPYLFFMPSTLFLKPNKSNLDDFRGTLAKDKTSITQIMKNLSLTEIISSYTLVTDVEPYTLNIYLEDIEAGYIKNFEMDASTIFLLVKDINEIVYHYNNLTTTYDINKINSIYGNIKNISLVDLEMRYGGKEFEKYTYLGRLGEYDVFDESDFCEETEQLIYEENDMNYYISCTKPEDIKLYDNGLRITSLKKALKEKKITVQQLLDSDLVISITGNEVDDENSHK